MIALMICTSAWAAWAQNAPLDIVKSVQATNQVEFKTTLGDFTIEVYPDNAPKTVQNFLQYVKSGHYNGTIFHRVIGNFMVQGGGFTSDMIHKDTRAPIPLEANNGLRNDRGSVAMARTSDPNSATSQFFINLADNNSLNGTSVIKGTGYAVFGKVTSGMETIEKIHSTPTGSKGAFQNVPLTPISIISVSTDAPATTEQTAQAAANTPTATTVTASVPQVMVGNQLLSDTRVVIGTGTCRTLRRAVYQNNDQIEIEIDRPYNGRCTFKQLTLVIDGIAIKGPSSVSLGIKSSNDGYFWSEPVGRVAFAYNKPLAKELVNSKTSFGLIDNLCTSSSCLTEEAFKNANVQAMFNEAEVREVMVQNSYDAVFVSYQNTKDLRLLDLLLKQVENDLTVDRTLALYGVAKDAKALVVANQLALKNKTVSNLMKVYDIDNQRETLKMAYSLASTPEEKRMVELAVIQSIQDKLFDFKVSMSGTGKTSSSDTNALIARIIQSNVTSTLTYSASLKTDVFTPTQDYLVDTIVTLTVKGKLNGERNCGILWLATCKIDNEDSSRTHVYNVPMRFTRAGKYKASGKTDIDWKSVSGGSGMASGYIMGGTVVFSATGAFDIQVKVKSVSLVN